MRLFHAAALAGAALTLASMASAQGLGDAAAREREKKSSSPAAKPAKVYTETDLGPSAPAPVEPDLPATPAAGASSTGATGAGSGAAAQGDAKAAAPGEKSEEEKAAELKAKQEAAWREELDQLRKAQQETQKAIDDIQVQLNDVTTM